MEKNKLVRGVEACGWGKTNLFGASRLVDGEKQTCSGRRGLWMGKNKLVRGVEACGWGKKNLFGASNGADHDLDPPFRKHHGAGNDHDATDLNHDGADHDLDPLFLNH